MYDQIGNYSYKKYKMCDEIPIPNRRCCRWSLGMDKRKSVHTYWPYHSIKVYSSPPSAAHAAVNQVSIGSDNGLSPIRRQAIIWTSAGLSSIGWTPRVRFQWNSKNRKLFIHENTSENIVCEKVAILSRGRGVDRAQARIMQVHYAMGQGYCKHLKCILNCIWLG